MKLRPLMIFAVMMVLFSGNVFALQFFEDLFDRADNSTVGNNWTEQEAATTNQEIDTQRLKVSRLDAGSTGETVAHGSNISSPGTELIFINYTINWTSGQNFVTALSEVNNDIDNTCGLSFLNGGGSPDRLFFINNINGAGSVINSSLQPDIDIAVGFQLNTTSLLIDVFIDYSIDDELDYTLIHSGTCDGGINTGFNHVLFGVQADSASTFVYNVTIYVNETGAGIGPPPPLEPEGAELIIEAFDLIGNASISNFSVTVFNSTATLTNSTQTGLLRIANVANETSYTVNMSSNNSGGFFDVNDTSVLVNLSTNLQVQMFQSFVTFNATQVFTEQTINGLNVSLNGQFVSSATNLAGIELQAATFTVEAAASNQFNITSFVLTTSPFDNTTIQLTFGDARFNFTAFDSLTNNTISGGYTLNISPNNLSTFANRSTVTPDILDFILLQGNVYDFTVVFNASNFVNVSGQFTIDAATGNISIFTFVTHTVNIQFFNEETNLPLIIPANETVTLDLIGPTTLNLTTANGTIFIQNLTPGDYEIRYATPSFTKRSFFFVLPPGGSDQLDLFLLNSTLDTLIIVTVVDENDDPINGSIVKLLRFYAQDNAFKIVEMSQADFNGDAPFNAILNTQEYRFLVDFPLGTNIFVSGEDSKVTSTTLRIQPTLGTSRLAFVKGLNLLSTSLIATTDGTNVTFRYTFSDGTGFSQDACLRVDQVSLIDGTTNLCEVCTSASTAVLICNVNITSGTLQGFGLVNSTNPHQIITDSLQIIISGAVATFGPYGVFLAALVMMSITAIGLFSVGAAVVAGMLALTVSALMGFVAISGGALIGLLISGILLFIKTRGR